MLTSSCSSNAVAALSARANSEGGDAGFCDRVILLAGASADADGTDHDAVARQRDAAGEDRHLAAVGVLDAEELLIRLRVLAEVLRRDVERLRGPGLVDRDVDAADPGAVLPDVGDEVAAGVDDGDVHRLADLIGLLLCGGDDASGVFEGDGAHFSCSFVRVIGSGGDVAVGIQDVFRGGARVELRVAAGCVIERDRLGVHGIRDMHCNKLVTCQDPEMGILDPRMLVP